MPSQVFQVIIIGGGHAGVEAAWAAANLLAETQCSGTIGGCASPRSGEHPHQRADAQPVALVTLDPTKIGVMSCNPAIGGLAKGQIVREIDAMGGLMGLATDAAAIQFKVLNTSKGPAVHGPRAQCDKHAYARAVQRLIASRPEIEVIGGSVEGLIVDGGRGVGGDRRVCGVRVRTPDGRELTLHAQAVVLTTGTFMRGLMHTGEAQTPGGRFGESAAVGISGALQELGFELGRLKTGTPPRLRKSTIRWEELERALGDERPVPFSELSLDDQAAAVNPLLGEPSSRFPIMPQVECRLTHTNEGVHELIRENLHRAPMYSGQIESVGPRYCPSIEDKVVRFSERTSHQVFLEPESLDVEHEHHEWVYCNGISTSLPADVQERIVRSLRGCEGAEILRYGYAVEYDMVKPHQISATGQAKLVAGLFLAGQINGTSGYEEAAGQGLIAGLNAARLVLGDEPLSLGREQAYIGVMMDDLVTKTPTEPYRMFTSRAEHRLLLRADNAPERLTPLAKQLGLLGGTALGRARERVFERQALQSRELNAWIDRARSSDGLFLRELVRRPEFSPERLRELARKDGVLCDERVALTALADRQYESYIARQHAEVRRQESMERKRIPAPAFAEHVLANMRTEARQSLLRFRPETFGQAGRLEGITPADLTLLAVLIKKHAVEASSHINTT